MKKIYNVFTLLVVALMGLSLAACSNDNLDTNQYKGEVSLNVYGPSPVMRGGTLRFLGSNLDQVREVIIPDGISITNIEVKQAGVPSEIRVTVPKDGPVPGKVVLVTNTDLIITTKTDLKYTESIVITSFPLAAMPGDVIKIEGDYLNLVQSLAFADNVLVSMEDFKSHSRYAIEVEVPEEAKTGKLALYTADLTVVDKNSVDYQIIETESAIEIGVPTIHKLKGRNEAEALGNITAKAGETITITGTYLQLTDDITIGGISADDLKITNDDTDITFTLPAEAPDGDILLVCKSGIEVPVGTLTTVKPTNCVATPNPVKAGQALQIDGKDMDLVTDVVFADSKGEYTIANNQNIINTKQAYAVTVPETATEGNLKLAMANG
ncbi:MAG: polygalacturonase, partial [Prevotella sp.]|nr:polygalacturonase [Prevotella sp.]